ncbi:MAG: 4-hydroxy-3-methylbut-2-enyl diphosphate reductase [Bacteroidetes bacterium]|uniref:4-hydroxy-3-methylbut-2-enyl diphosphate reductase n=1 Tax=Candidatus Egerieousia excrementavium TaxID=2840778 RepID=A0A9D9DMC3_9BACT|nr:4-hydroxy-3-methylbut-2-enyl diphosphate reductase [Candidatus Egerieousia excrementavium]
MKLKVEIDSRSGFCNGVIRAVKEAEDNLEKRRPLYSLGAIVHNNSELQRLHEQGLEIIDLDKMRNMNGGTVLIRAHGEPPSTYILARERGITLIDCTCPVVLKLQERIRNTYKEILQNGNRGQIVIFGKENHAEVNGLVGQVESNAIVTDILPGGKIKGLEKIDFSRPVFIFSQTTKDPQEYESVCRAILEKMEDKDSLFIFNTICRQVAGRHANLARFAVNHDFILFVSGPDSSNGKVLFELCKSVNRRSYHIQEVGEIDASLFYDGASVGICGATSTPKWQLENVAEYLGRL